MPLPAKRLLTLLTPLAAAFLAGSVAAADPAAGPLHQPVFESDFPDPFVLGTRGRWFAYATNNNKEKVNIQLASSTDLIHWQTATDPADPKRPRDALPVLPPWAKRGSTWAPEVLQTETGYILYFTARSKKEGVQCVGTAASTDPEGPFTSSAAEPLVCQTKLGGTIDASPFRDTDGQLYLYYKNDGNAVRKPTWIWGQRLSADGLGLTGPASQMLVNDQPWEAHVIEAPSMVRTSASYVMFYSANDYAWQPDQRASAYATGYARCTGPLGPCTDAANNPILASRIDKPNCLSGPGHQTVFSDGRASYIAFHAWAATRQCARGPDKRYMYIAPLAIRSGVPAIGPSPPPAPVPPPAD